MGDSLKYKNKVMTLEKKIVLIAGSTSTKKTLHNQIMEFLPNNIVLESYASEEGIVSPLKGEILVISSDKMKEELNRLGIVYEFKGIIVCQRTINIDFIEKLADIPLNEEVLLVNDERETTENAISDLIGLGLNHIKFYPYYPGIQSYKRLRMAVTPGETDKIPSCIEEVIDIGPRIMDINTIYNIMDTLNLDMKDTRFFTNRYIEKIVKVSKRISSISDEVNALNGYLNNIVDSLVNGIIVFDESGYIKYSNDEMKRTLSLENKSIRDRNIKNIIDREVLAYFLNNETYENKPLNLLGQNLRLSKFKIPNSKNIVVTTNRDNKDDISKKFSQELLLKGHLANYTFIDIKGNSSIMNDVKDIALKLSKTELTVLIEGESGTGKELFASAIHNKSTRKYGPYLAVNFGALPDDLIESELFGYEEGAFTGAKKGGKIGLFELADGGTIFLDEIGDISPKVQTKLLRVLQEKKIMPLGGSNIKSVDVRIIAATNKDLREMVSKKEFRSDLYYRLKIGYINIPPLRDRLEDLEELVDYFIQVETRDPIDISKEVLKEFKKHKWLGNVRELESTIKYMLAVRTKDKLTIEDLPDRKFFEEGMEECPSGVDEDLEYGLNEEMLEILVAIDKIGYSNSIASRKKILWELKEEGYDLTDNQIRNRLEGLCRMGFVKKLSGRYGMIITSKGKNQLIK